MPRFSRDMTAQEHTTPAFAAIAKLVPNRHHSAPMASKPAKSKPPATPIPAE